MEMIDISEESELCRTRSWRLGESLRQVRDHTIFYGGLTPTLAESDRHGYAGHGMEPACGSV